MRKYLLVILAGMCAAIVSGQVSRDTSFTIRSNHVKLLKHFDFITPITPHVPENVSADEEVTYCVRDAHELKASIYFPKDRSQTYPGVLLIHGGGWSSGNRANLIPMAQDLAAAGYVAMAIEYRLSPEAQYPAGVLDLLYGVRWLRAHASTFGLDTSRIAALGCSAGAQLASLLGVVGNKDVFSEETDLNGYSARIQAVVNIDGIVSFVHPEADAEGTYAAKWLGGTRQTAWENWRAASALEYVDETSPPFYFINSAQPRFHAGRDDMMQMLSGYGIYAGMHTIEDTPHGFWLVHPWYEETLEHTLTFLDKVFKDGK